jgi:zinc transporter ZupT
VLAACTFLGVLGMNRFAEAVHWAMPLSTGVTIYVAASDLIPEVNTAHNIRMPLAVFLGVALFALCELALARLGVAG